MNDERDELLAAAEDLASWLRRRGEYRRALCVERLAARLRDLEDKRGEAEPDAGDDRDAVVVSTALLRMVATTALAVAEHDQDEQQTGDGGAVRVEDNAGSGDSA